MDDSWNATVLVVQDASDSTNRSLGMTTRRHAMKSASSTLLTILQEAPCPERIALAQVLFATRATIHLRPTPVPRLRPDNLGNWAFLIGGRTDICAALVKSEAALKLPIDNGQGVFAGTWLQGLVGWLESQDTAPTGQQLTLPGEVHLLLITDGELTAGGSEEDCVRQAQRLRAAGVHIYAQGIGDPAQFGLLPRLVTNPLEDFAVHQTPESLINAFRRIAQRLVRSV